MQYQGGKHFIAKPIAQLLNEHRLPEQAYWEPMVGGCNIVTRITAPVRFASDLNPLIIAYWQAAQAGWCPPTDVTATDYRHALNGVYDDDPKLKAWLLFGCSFRGIYGKAFAAGMRVGSKLCYVQESANNTHRKVPRLRDVNFSCSDFLRAPAPAPRLQIYCDPPYANTMGYRGNADVFEHDTFWAKCRTLAAEGHDVFVSESTAPPDIQCVWQREVPNNVSKYKTRRNECLFYLGDRVPPIVQCGLL